MRANVSCISYALRTDTFQCILAFRLYTNAAPSHRKQLYLKTPPKVEISKNSVFVFAWRHSENSV